MQLGLIAEKAISKTITCVFILLMIFFILQSTITNTTSKQHPLASKPVTSNTSVSSKPMMDNQFGSKPSIYLDGQPPSMNKSSFTNSQNLPTVRKDPALAPAGGLSSLLKGLKKDDKDGKGSQMVTIRRVMDPVSSEPTVTITLKGDEPEKDKVLFKLVNGQGMLFNYQIIICRYKKVLCE